MLSEALSYHNDLIEQGYSEEEAEEHTLRYFPDFSLDGRKADPAPPPGFDFIPSSKKENVANEQSSINLDKILFKAGVMFDNAKITIKENKKIVYTISGIAAALLVVYLIITLIPASIHPIEGEWTRTDDETWTFNMDGSFEDSTGYDAEWEIDGDQLTITTTIGSGDNFIQIIQTGEQKFSSDENAMWIKWTKITENGEDITPENQPCILLIKDSNSYSEDAGEYISKAPSWCE